MLFPTISSIASQPVIRLPATATLAEAARTMATHTTNTIVVTTPQGHRLFLSSLLLSLEAQEHDMQTPLGALDLPWAVTLSSDATVLDGLKGIRNPSEPVCLQDATGALQGVVSYSDLLDSLNEQARVEQDRCAESEYHFRTLFELYPDATLIIDPENGLPVQFNRLAHEQLGYTAAEFARLRIPDYEALETPEEIGAHIRKIFAEGQDNFETRHRRKDGRLIDVRVSVVLLPFKERTLFLAVFRDITPRKMAEQAQKILTERLALATSAAGLGIWDYDLSSGHLDWDAGMFRLYGLQPQDFGHAFEDWAKALTPDSRETAIAAFQAAVESDRPFDIRIVIRRSDDGTLRTLHGQAQVIRDSVGQAVRVVGVNRDVSAEEASRRQLAAAEAKFRSLFELSPVGIAMNDYATGAFLDFNDAIIEPTGYSRGEFKQLDYWTVTPKEYMAAEQTMLDSMERTGRYGPFHKEYIRKDGSRYPVLLHGFKTTTLEGREVIWSIIQDISDIEKTRQALESTRNQLASLAAQLPGFIYQYQLWPDHHAAFVYASTGITRIYGTTPDEVAEDASCIFQMLHEDDLDSIAQSIQQSAQTLTPWHETYRVNHPDQGLIWVEGHATPERLADGSTLWHGYIHDVTERMNAERGLADSKAQLDAFFAQSVSGFFFMMLDKPLDWRNADATEKELLLDYAMTHQRMTKVNQALLDQYGVTEQDFIGLNIRELFAHDLDHARAVWRQLFELGRSHVETYEQRRDGTPIIIDGDYICLYDEQGRVTGHFGVQHDITERKRQQEALELARKQAEHASRAKSEFLANMSHEIRTPMNAIIGLSQLLAHTDLNDKQRDQIHKIQHSSRMLLGILNDILDFSKIEAGRLELDAHDFRLSDVVEQMVTLFGEKAHSSGLELLYDIPPDLPRSLVGDSLRLAQILGNLLGNATKFTDAGGTVELGIHAVGPVSDTKATLRFQVRDTGIGMSEEQLTRLFQPFSQADTSTTRRYGGTGLGLVISRRLVEAMGGTLEVESVLNQGSTFAFTLTLPLGAEVRAEGGASLRRAVTAIEIPQLQGRRLLVVEDNAINQEVVTQLLKKTGACVRTVANGAEALTAVRAKAPDLILMDLQMPVMDGFEATRTLRAEGYSGPIIALSAAVMDDDRQRSCEAGANSHLGKPIDSRDLYAALLDHLEIQAGVDNNNPVVEPATAPFASAELPGFDLKRGLRQFDGEEALYARLLRIFSDNLASDYLPLVEYLRTGRYAEAHRIAHTLKGVAGTLAATDLQPLAEHIEQHLKHGQPVVTAVIDHLEQALHEVQQSLEQFTYTPEARPTASAAAVTALRQCLEASELIEETTLQEALGFLRSQNLDCDALEAFIEQMAFDEALHCLDTLWPDTGEAQ